MEKEYCALFDFDGVVVNTEKYYTDLWNAIGRQYLDMDSLAEKIKGTTLDETFSEYFTRSTQNDRDRIEARVDRMEREMPYEAVPGVEDFIRELRHHGVKVALVTSSNMKKMASAFHARCELPAMFDLIITAEDVSRSKPAPECYCKAMTILGIGPSRSCVFEDSFNGLTSARDSGAHVVALSTTNPPESLTGKADKIIPDFKDFTFGDFMNIFK